MVRPWFAPLLLAQERASYRTQSWRPPFSVTRAILGQLPQAFLSESRTQVSPDLPASKGSREQHTYSHIHTHAAQTLSPVSLLYAHMYTYSFRHTHMHTEIHMHAYLHAYPPTHSQTQTYAHVYTHMPAHIYIFIHTHIHKHLPSIHSLAYLFTFLLTHTYECTYTRIHHSCTLTNALT